MKITVDSISFEVDSMSLFQRIKAAVVMLLTGRLTIAGCVTLDVTGSASIDTGDTNDTK